MKRLTLGLTATAIITLGVFAFTGCEKEEVADFKIIKSVCDTPEPGNGQGGPSNQRFFRWFMTNIYDNEDNKCYVAMVCEGPFQTAQRPSCNTPQKTVFVFDENCQRIETECNSVLHPFPDIDPERKWEFEFTKEHIEETWSILQKMYELEILSESPQELWDEAPHR